MSVSRFPVFVLVRVFDRIPDLGVCLETIRTTWVENDYQVVVVSNGGGQGHRIPPADLGSFELLSLEQNAGHIRGNSQLLVEGLRRMSAECRYVVLIEADTWLFGDALITRIIRRMESRDWVWSSASWLDRYHSLALDFAVVSADAARSHPELFDFARHAECHVANTLRAKHLGYGFIPELMPVHVPRFVRALTPPTGGRFRCFPQAPIVSHHVEELAGGMEEKKWWANATLGREEFLVANPTNWEAQRRRLVWAQRLAKLSPRASWLRSKSEKDMAAD